MLLSACTAPLARPVLLDTAAAEAQTPSAQEAAQLSPLTHAEAEKLRREAEQAYTAGDPTSAQILAEQAIATFSRAFLQARIARSNNSEEELKAPNEAAAAELEKLQAEQKQVMAELQDLEIRIKVLRDAPPIVSSGKAQSAERENARREAVQALLTEARLLCLSARMLAPEAEGLKGAEEAITTVAKQLEDRKQPAPIDSAMRARAGCLDTLSSSRRTLSAQGVSGDALLTSLGKANFQPIREDRGVVITLHDAFSGDNVSRNTSEQLEGLGRIVAANPTTPILIVLHDAESPRANAKKRDEKRADAIKSFLIKHRSEKIEVYLAGATRPIVAPENKKDRARNERVEIIFVDTGSLRIWIYNTRGRCCLIASKETGVSMGAPPSL